jgi:hypothetical protein
MRRTLGLALMLSGSIAGLAIAQSSHSDTSSGHAEPTSWAYSDWMPVIPIAGLSIGLSPLLQWIVVPAAAFAITGRGQNKQTDGGRP